MCFFPIYFENVNTLKKKCWRNIWIIFLMFPDAMIFFAISHLSQQDSACFIICIIVIFCCIEFCKWYGLDNRRKLNIFQSALLKTKNNLYMILTFTWKQTHLFFFTLTDATIFSLYTFKSARFRLFFFASKSLANEQRAMERLADAKHVSRTRSLFQLVVLLFLPYFLQIRAQH